MIVQHSLNKWFIAVILLILLLSACERQTSKSASGTATVSLKSGAIVNSPIATTGCAKNSPVVPGRTADAAITSNSVQRTYRLHVPTGYSSDQMTPLVFAIHGHEGTAEQIERYTQYSALADQQHFLVVYPQGLVGPDGKTGWAAYGQKASTANDVLFFSDLLTALQQQLCIDPHRIYATGISNGGGMTNLLACQMAGRIAAFAPVASAVYPIPGGCHPARPVPYLEFHGTSDPLVPYNGNTTVRFLPVMQMMQDWANRDGCTSGPATFFRQDEVTGLQWTNCQGGVIVQHYRIDGGGHTWPGAVNASALGATTRTISATTLGWQFFQQYPLP